MDWDFLLGAAIVILGAWGLAGLVVALARRETKRRNEGLANKPADYDQAMAAGRRFAGRYRQTMTDLSDGDER